MIAPRPKAEPTHDEVLAALEQIVASDIVRHSPQLIAFLQFIVETTLRGKGNNIKGYTIGTEALGREESFDPQIDPIVRVEAGRLRRALKHYYAGPGATDDVVIDLPRGHYVPTFHRRSDQPVSAFSLREGIRRRSLGTVPLARGMSLAALVLVLVGTAAVLVIGRWDRQTSTTAVASSDRDLMSRFRPGNGFPVVSIRPFEAVGTPAASKITLDGLHRKLTDALARFDEITVALAATTFAVAGEHTPREGPSASKYELGMTAEYRDNGTAALTFRLVDTGDNTLIWSRTFDPIQSSGDEDRIVGEVAGTLARTFGIIHAQERRKSGLDPRYGCVLKMLDYLHGLEAGEYIQARACLERVTRLDPNFAMGFAWLAWIYIREYQYEGLGPPGDPPALDRALKAAQRAVSLKPQSARAHEALLGAYFARGEVAASFAAGDTALSLNPFDPATRTVYGIRLVAVGQYDRGAAMLKETSANSVQRPPWLNSYLFLAAYLKGDLATAAQYANLDASETYPLTLLARALSAAGNGDRDKAKQMIDRLGTLHPAFHHNLRRELQKFIPSTVIVDRLTHDLAAAGLRVAN